MTHRTDTITPFGASLPDWLAVSLRLFMVAMAGLLVCLSVIMGSQAYQVGSASSQVDSWFKSGNLSLAGGDIERVRNRLQAADVREPGDAKAKLALAKLYILLAEAEREPAYLNAARQMANAASRLQPRHYEAYALLSDIDNRQGFSLYDSLVNLEKAVFLGGLVETVQPLIGPIVVKKWPYLPAELKEASGPMIKSMLSETHAREIILAAMEENQRAGPFTAFSPNKATSALLRDMDARFRNH